MGIKVRMPKGLPKGGFPKLSDLKVPKGGLLNPGLRKGFGKIRRKS